MPPRPPDAPPEADLAAPGVLEQLAVDAGLEPRTAFDLTWAYEYADEEELGRAMLAPMGLGGLVGPAREDEVRRQIVDALASCRTPYGGYRLENEFHVLIASA
jgi:hypothetical protein